MADYLIKPASVGTGPAAGCFVMLGIEDPATSPILAADTAYEAFELSAAFSFSTAAAATAPDAFVTADWTLSDPHTGTSLVVTILSMSAANGAAIGDIEYRINGGAWTSFGSAGLTDHTVAGLTTGEEVDVELRAVNGIGSGPGSDIKAQTPTALPILFNQGPTFDVVEFSVQSGLLTLNITEPAELAGEITFDTSTASTAPINLIPPTVSGGDTEGSVKTAGLSLWFADKALGELAITQTWDEGGAMIGGETGLTHTVTTGDVANGLDFTQTGTQGTASAAVEVIAIAAPAPGIPETMAAPALSLSGGGSVLVTRGSAPSANGSAITGYKMRWRPSSGGAWTPVDPFGATEDVTDLTTDTEYEFQQLATNGAGDGLWSASALATPTVSSYTEAPLAFDGSTNYLRRTADLAADGNTQFIFASFTTPAVLARRSLFSMDGGGYFRVNGTDGSVTFQLAYDDATTKTIIGAAIAAPSTRYSILLSATRNDRGKMWVKAGSGAWAEIDNQPIDDKAFDTTLGSWCIGGRDKASPDQLWAGDIHRIAIWPGLTTTPDIASAAVQDWFTNADGTTVDPATSITNIGTIPVCDVHGGTTANIGSGGAFDTIGGTF